MKFDRMQEMPVEKPRSSVLKRIGKLFLWLFAVVLLLLGALLALLFAYEDEVKAAVLKELNKHLKAEVRIDPKNIDLTVIRSFPDCSVRFKDLLMLEALPLKQRDTLLFTRELDLHFNISNIWQKKYDIEKISINQSLVKLRVFKNGSNNYTFWQESQAPANAQPDSVSFNLKQIAISNCRLQYINKQQHIKTELLVKNIHFSGAFRQSDYDLRTDASLLIDQLVHEKSTYLKNKELNFALELAVSKDQYTFKKTKIRLNDLELALNGGFAYRDSLQRMSVAFSTPNLDIASLLSLMPATFKSKLNDYESSGNFYAQGKIDYAGPKQYSINSEFGIKKGSITYKPKSTTASPVNLNGTLLLTPTRSQLELKDVYLRLSGDELKGSCTISNFSAPHIKLKAEANSHLANLQAFFPIDTLTQLNGELRLHTDVEGSLRDLQNETFSTKVRLDLEAQVSNLVVQFKHDEQVFAVESCAITAHNREIEVKDLKLKRGSSDILLNGKIPGVFNYLTNREAPLLISGSLVSEHIRLEDFIKPTGSAASASNNDPLIPANVQFRLNTEIKKFTFAKFEANAVSGEIDIKDQKAVISDVKLETMQGNAEISAFADNSKGKLEIVLESHLRSINIQSLFTQFNNFGQTTLQDKNIKGYVSADIEFSGTWNNQLKADYSSIRAACNLQVERGELNDFKPLLSLSKFVEVQDLQRIRFSTLQSNVRISNGTITFPKTSIKNSALNIEFQGSHTFNNAIEYHIQLLISELLAKRRKNKDDEFGPVENDKENRRSAFILMTGTVDNPVIKFDRKGMKQKIKDDIKEEKHNVRQILKEEFGFFKKDSLPRKNKSDQYFELEKPNNNPPKKTLELKKKPGEDEDL